MRSGNGGRILIQRGGCDDWSAEIWESEARYCRLCLVGFQLRSQSIVCLGHEVLSAARSLHDHDGYGVFATCWSAPNGSLQYGGRSQLV